MPASSTPLLDGRFLLLETLGRGGMGAVYRAFDRTEQRLVAVKLLRQSAEPGPDHPLSTEFEAWSGFRHPNIVRAYELGRAHSGPISRDRPYLVLEHVAGGPVHEVFRPGSVPVRALESLTKQLLRALVHVHAVGLIHRDLKPANVLVARNTAAGTRIKLTDFGLAAPIGLTRQVGSISGSLRYVSPEALLGQPLDARTDLYGLGVLLYHLATGALPGRAPDEILHWHLAGPPADLSGHDLPGPLSRLVRRLTSRNRDRRPASAVAALRLLGEATESGLAAKTTLADRGKRARLRLALDAARAGAVRLLPIECDDAGRVVAEVGVWAQVRGMRFYRVTTRAFDGVTALGRLVLHLLAERGNEALACIRRYGLDRALPLGSIGGLPVLDAHRPGDNGARPGPEALARSARGIRGFLLGCAERRATVLHVDAQTRKEPLLAEVIRQLGTAVSRPDPLAGARGGLLLLLATPAASNKPTHPG